MDEKRFSRWISNSFTLGVYSAELSGYSHQSIINGCTMYFEYSCFEGQYSGWGGNITAKVSYQVKRASDNAVSKVKLDVEPVWQEAFELGVCM